MRIACTVAALMGLFATSADAGLTAHIGRELTKGVTHQLKKETGDVDLHKSAHDMGEGLADAVADQ